MVTYFKSAQKNTRPSSTRKSANSAHDESELMGWHDDLDEVVYAAAVEVSGLLLKNLKPSCRVNDK